MLKTNQIYFDYEANIGVNAYFIWGHHFFKSYDEFEMFIYERFKNDFELIEITDDNYEELMRLGVFACAY